MRALLIALAVLAACKDDPNIEVCQHYAELAVKCKPDAQNPRVLRDTAENFCRKGMSGKHDEVFGARYKTMIECTRTANSCEDFEKCKSPE